MRKNPRLVFIALLKELEASGVMYVDMTFYKYVMSNVNLNFWVSTKCGHVPGYLGAQ